MKKLTAFLIIFTYMTICVNPCFALTKLYYLHNADKTTVSSRIEKIITDKDYTIKKTNPFYAVSNDEPQNYSVIFLQQEGNNLYYFYDSNNKSKKINKAVLKNLKEYNIEYEERVSTSLIDTFTQTTQRALSGEKKKYTFEEPNSTYTTKTNTKNINTPPTTLKGFAGKIGKGDELNVYLQNAINTSTADIGDNVTGVLKTDWLTSDNHVIAEKGSLLYGEVTKAHSAQYGMRNGFVRISFYKMETPSGKTYNISTKNIDFNVSNDGVVMNTVGKAVSATIAGAAVGALVSLISGGNGSDVLKGVAIGAGIGGAGSLVTSGVEKGIDAEIPAYTDIEVVLLKDVDVVINY